MKYNIARTGLAIVFAVSLGLASPAQAKIVYHSADVKINDGYYNLDLNHDGITDFTIWVGNNATICAGVSVVAESPASGNGTLLGPLNLGDQIGPVDAFDSGAAGLASATGHKDPHHVPMCYVSSGGSWRTSASGYLGLSFQIDGQTFYGWVCLVVKRPNILTFTATLLGYAYETTPGMAISAGETSYVQFIPVTLQFGKVPLGDSVQSSVILMNWLTTTLLINNATLTGVNSAAFTSGNGNPPCSGSVAAGASCTLTFTFTPSIAGNETAIYSVYDDGGVSPQKLQLRGTGQ